MLVAVYHFNMAASIDVTSARKYSPLVLQHRPPSAQVEASVAAIVASACSRRRPYQNRLLVSCCASHRRRPCDALRHANALKDKEAQSSAPVSHDYRLPADIRATVAGQGFDVD